MFFGTYVTDPGNKFAVEVLINGSPAELFRRSGDGKVFVAGQPGQHYTLRVHNMTLGRLEIVCAVDQRSTTIDGPATLDNRGMIVDPGDSGEFKGWRLNSGSVGEFVFADLGSDVSTQATGGAGGAGIIGFAAFTELASVPQSLPYMPDPASGPFARRSEGYGSRFGGGEELLRMPVESYGPSVGTGIGPTIPDPVRVVRFQRAGGAPSVLAIGYHTPDMLAAMGVLRREPLPFPEQRPFGTGYDAYRRVR
ncbi:MAG TPA: hypothetical protein VLA88_01245 [Candidatus Saccharimonadales bacterium]|nr:hypothetical protein [Candidatus Saccharimonadales bacterium]